MQASRRKKEKMRRPHLCPWGSCRFERAQKMRQRCDCSLLIKHCQNSVRLCSPWPFPERKPPELNWVPICFQAAWPRIGGKSCLKSQREANLTPENHQLPQTIILHERLMINHLIGGQNEICRCAKPLSSHSNLKGFTYMTLVLETVKKTRHLINALTRTALKNSSYVTLSYNNPTWKLVFWIFNSKIDIFFQRLHLEADI